MGIVFVNYRAQDNPLGAAGIHDMLARRFGGDRVFRDCVSMAAGDHYPTTLRASLERADVLVVVIGPRWNELADEQGRVLIQRDRDWVRWEIARAIDRGIPIIPVLLRDAPGDATPPDRTILPADIRKLADYQTLDVSQKRFGADLDRLADRLVEQVPSLLTPDPTAPQRTSDNAASTSARPEPGVPTPSPTTGTGPATQVRSIAGETHASRSSPTTPRPQQLPCPPTSFIGRSAELAQLTAVLAHHNRSGTPVPVATIGGGGGIGKTWLALRWAHQHVDQFPDGQLFVNLRGFDPSGLPTPPADALSGFLEALGVHPQSVPTNVDAQSALFRSLTTDKRILIILDNARDAPQIMPLLPGTGSCAVVVTSRQRLTDVAVTHGARLVDLDTLDDTDARDVLAHHVDPGRLSSEPDAVARLMAVCAGWPLALRIAAARAADHPDFPLALLADELHEESARLHGLRAGDPHANLQAVLSWSYRALKPHAMTTLRLLGLAPGPDISLPAVTALTGLAVHQARLVLRDLENLSLLLQHEPGRYRMHDLIRLHASQDAGHSLSTDSHGTALRRLTDFYLQTAHLGNRLLTRSDEGVVVDPPATNCRPHPLSNAPAALRWFTAEHQCLLATRQLAVACGWHTVVWELAFALDVFHLRRGYLRDSIRCWRAGLAAAHQLGDPATISVATSLLARAYVGVGYYIEAIEMLNQALVLAESTRGVRRQARIHVVLTVAWRERGDLQQAVTHATRALDLFRTLEDVVCQAGALNNLGWCQAHLGHYEQARAACERALAVLGQCGHRDDLAPVLDSLGYIAHHTGRHRHALEYYRQALAQYRRVGDAYLEADTLAHLGATYAALDRPVDAQRVWSRAWRLYLEQHRTGHAHRIRQQLASRDRGPAVEIGPAPP